MGLQRLIDHAHNNLLERLRDHDNLLDFIVLLWGCCEEVQNIHDLSFECQWGCRVSKHDHIWVEYMLVGWVRWFATELYDNRRKVTKSVQIAIFSTKIQNFLPIKHLFHYESLSFICASLFADYTMIYAIVCNILFVWRLKQTWVSMIFFCFVILHKY